MRGVFHKCLKLILSFCPLRIDTSAPRVDLKGHTELKIFSGHIHFPEEADKILGGSLIPPEREKKASKE